MMTSPVITETKTIRKPPQFMKIIYVCLGHPNMEDCSEIYQEEIQAISHLSNFMHEILRIEITLSDIKPVLLVPKELKVLGMVQREVV